MAREGILRCVTEATLYAGTVMKRSVQGVASSQHESEAGLISCTAPGMNQLGIKAASCSVCMS